MASIGSTVLPSPPDTEYASPQYIRGEIAVAPGGSVSVFTWVVPALTIRRLKLLWVKAINDGDFSLQANGVEIATGRISVVQHNISFKFDPPRPIAAGVTLELLFVADSEPSVACPVTAFLSGYDLTI